MRYDALVPLRIDEPYLFVRRIGEVDFAARVDGQIIRIHALRDDRFLPVRTVGDDAFAAILTGVKTAVGPEHQAVGLAGIFFEHGDFAVERDLVNPAVGNIAEEYVSMRI